jgi:hypothetical protein
MFKTELLHRRDWLKIALFVLLFGGLVFGGLYWLTKATEVGSFYPTSI